MHSLILLEISAGLVKFFDLITTFLIVTNYPIKNSLSVDNFDDSENNAELLTDVSGTQK